MWQHKWVESLQKFSFEIKFRLGKENQAISLVSLSLPKDIQQNVLIDKLFGPLILEIYNQNISKNLENYAMKEGLLFFKGRICILRSLRAQILKEAHKSPLATHPSYQKMFYSLKEKFFWS